VQFSIKLCSSNWILFKSKDFFYKKPHPKSLSYGPSASSSPCTEKESWGASSPFALTGVLRHNYSTKEPREVVEPLGELIST
jgi:hypothetical protein